MIWLSDLLEPAENF
jgi:hypothetical protein